MEASVNSRLRMKMGTHRARNNNVRTLRLLTTYKNRRRDLFYCLVSLFLVLARNVYIVVFVIGTGQDVLTS